MNREEDNGDRLLACCDCGDDFLWTASEQRFYRVKDLARPRRCLRCRAAKRLEYERRQAVRGAA